MTIALALVSWKVSIKGPQYYSLKILEINYFILSSYTRFYTLSLTSLSLLNITVIKIINSYMVVWRLHHFHLLNHTLL